MLLGMAAVMISIGALFQTLVTHWVDSKASVEHQVVAHGGAAQDALSDERVVFPLVTASVGVVVGRPVACHRVMATPCVRTCTDHAARRVHLAHRAAGRRAR